MLGRRKSETIGRVVLVGTAIFGLGRVAVAEPESVRIDYAAPDGCPDAAAFVRSLRERTKRFREAAPDEQARRFLVHVKAAGSSFTGRLEIRSPDGPTAVRNVEATVCNEVSSALSLITALTIDPDTLTGSSGASKSRAEPPPRSAEEPDRQQSPPSTTTVATLPPPEATQASQPWRWSIAPASGTPPGTGARSTCTGEVAALIAHGQNDPMIPFTQGQATRDLWIAQNGCTTQTITWASESACVEYQGCQPDLPVVWCVHGEGHAWAGLGRDCNRDAGVCFDGGSAIWAFFSSFH